MDKEMRMEFQLFRMVLKMLDSLNAIALMAKVFIHGHQGKNTKGIGKMEK
jgi:hypothetical protein